MADPAETPRHTPTGSALIDPTTRMFMALAAVAAAGVTLVKGPPALWDALWKAGSLIVFVAPLIALGLFLGGLAKEVSDPRRIAPLLGDRSGWSGLMLATVLGAVTPGGPFASFPIVYALFATGADVGAVVAYLTGWSLIAVHRVIVWELPLLGWDFSLVRVLVSLPLPVLAGALARAIARGPLRVDPPTGPRPGAS